MITCKLYGRLGNQMSQIAATIGYAVKHNMAYYIPAQSERPAEWPAFFPHLTSGIPQFGGVYDYKEPSQAYHEIPYYPNICLDGHFPSDQYWSHCRNRILRSFNIPWNEEKGKGWVAIHVRRGDYLNHSKIHPVVTEEYLVSAIGFFQRQGYYKFNFFSDDPTWCQDFFTKHYSTSNGDNWVLFSTEETMNALSDMSSCEHQIISNSTYSLWAAHLNQNKGKIIIAPKVWTSIISILYLLRSKSKSSSSSTFTSSL